MAQKRNRAKPQRGSFLTRGREQVRQRQQTRQQASRQLPAKGESTAGSVKARGQRLKSAVEQRARMDVTRTRALGQMLQRNADRNARSEGIRQESRMTSGKTRYVPPGGENTKGQASLPPGQRGGDMRQKGGPLAKRESSAMTERSREVSRGDNGGPVRPVRVRDMGNTSRPQMSPGQQRSLPESKPSARRQAAQSKADAAARGSQGPNRVGQPAGSANRMYGANVVNAAVDRAMRQPRPSARGNIATAVTSTLGQMAVRPAARAAGKKLGEALRPMGRAIDDALPGMNSRDERSRKTNTPYQTRFPQARANAQTRVNRIKAGIPDQPNRPSQATTPQRPRIAGSTQSRSGSTQSGGRTSSVTRSQTTSRVAAPTAPTERRVSAATANRESGNYGTSQSNNKLLDGFLRDRMLQREATQQEAALTSDEKATLLKINKMKEEEKKKKK